MTARRPSPPQLPFDRSAFDRTLRKQIADALEDSQYGDRRLTPGQFKALKAADAFLANGAVR